jgi:hypothetical protein
MRILRKHVGSRVDFTGFNRAAGCEQTGTVAEVVNGHAVIMVPHFNILECHDDEVYVARERSNTGEPFRVVLPVDHAHIIRVW